MPPETITTARLILRPFEDRDGAAVVEGLNDLAVSEWLANVPFPFGPKDLRLMRDTGQTRWPDLIAVEAEGRVIGAVSTGAHFGFWIRRSHWGRGFATEAASAALPIARPRAAVIESGYFAGNTASARILLRLGFKVTGRGQTYCTALDRMRPDLTLQLGGVS